MSEHGKTRIYSIIGIGPGTQLNGLFEIDEKIAAGGMGEVYRGHEIQSGHPIAIKIVLSEFAKDETIVGLFNKEARILRDLNHPAIVRYMAFGTDPVIGRPYLVMEFVDGPSLSSRLDAGPLELSEAKHLFARLASGLDAAHQLGVIHRDISCDNVILAQGNVSSAKIIDFGIARTKKGATLLEGKFAGKYNFVSPEQLGLFNGEISEATDTYSLGLLMVNALRGEPIDMNGTQLEIIEKRRVVPDISDIDPAIRPIIEEMLQPDPADRKLTMADITEWFAPVRERSKPPRSRPPISQADAAAGEERAVPMPPPDALKPGARGAGKREEGVGGAPPSKPVNAILNASAELNGLAGSGARPADPPGDGVQLPTFHRGVLPAGSAAASGPQYQKAAKGGGLAIAAAVAAVIGLGSAYWYLGRDLPPGGTEAPKADAPSLTPNPAPPGATAKIFVRSGPSVQFRAEWQRIRASACRGAAGRHKK